MDRPAIKALTHYLAKNKKRKEKNVGIKVIAHREGCRMQPRWQLERHSRLSVLSLKF